MPSNGTAQSFTDIDFAAAVALPYFGDTGILGPLSRVTEMRIQAGEPSYALCYIPMDKIHRIAPSICGVSSSILDATKHIGQLVQIKGSLTSKGSDTTAQTILMNGRMVDLNQELFQDKAVIRIEDDRCLLRGVALPGSFWLSGTDKIVFRQGWPAHFNPGSRPNAIWVQGGGGSKIPVFCHPFWGLKDHQDVPESNNQDEKQACYWTPQMKIIYMRYATSETVVSTLSSAFPWLAAIPDSIIWPEGLESFLTDTTGLPDRKGREATLEGNLFAALRAAVMEAGPFDIFLVPNDAGQSTLAFVRTKYIGSSQSSGVSTSSNNSAPAGVSLIRAIAGKAQDVLTTPGIINAGSVRENSQNTVTRVAVAGHVAVSEQRLTSNLDPTKVDETITIIQGWSQDEIGHFKDYMLNGDGTSYTGLNGNVFTTLPEAFTMALRKYWRTLKVWYLNPAYDIRKNTSADGKFPFCSTTRPPLPHLLALYIEDNAAGSGNLLANLSTRREIPLEVDPFPYADGQTPSDMNFTPLPLNHGVQIAPDGSLDLTGLVEQVQASTVTIHNSNGLFDISPASVTSGTKTTYNFDDPSTFRISRIRISVAIPFDHRVVGAAKLPGDPTGTAVPPNGFPVDDSDRIDFSQSKLAYVNALGLLANEERASGATQSWPVPESVIGETAADFPPGSLRDDTPEANNQAARKAFDLCRLDRTQMVSSNKIALTYEPGMMLDSLTNIGGAGGKVNLRSAVSAVSYYFEEKPQRLVIHGN